MKKTDVKVGQVYSAKVSGNVVPVQIDRENPRGGWDGTNMKTKKSVRIKSAQRLRGKAATWPGKKTTKSADGVAETVAAVEKGDLTKGIKVPPAKKKRQPTAEKPPTQRKPSGLDAAAKVRAEAGEPMGTREMVERMLAKGLWKTNGKTPAATIYAAIIREIAKAGDKARFRKVERGKFELAK